jgi:hypothetical protein
MCPHTAIYVSSYCYILRSAQWKGPRLEQDVNPMRALNDAPHTWSATPASVSRSKNVLDSLNAQPHVWKGPGSEGPNPIE